MVDVVDHFNHTLKRVMHGHMCDMVSMWNQEPLKAAMEHATDNYIWVPLKHKLTSVSFHISKMQDLSVVSVCNKLCQHIANKVHSIRSSSAYVSDYIQKCELLEILCISMAQ